MLEITHMYTYIRTLTPAGGTPWVYSCAVENNKESSVLLRDPHTQKIVDRRIIVIQILTDLTDKQDKRGENKLE